MRHFDVQDLECVSLSKCDTYSSVITIQHCVVYNSANAGTHRCPDAAERRHVSRQIYQSAAERRSWCEVTVISSTPPPFENNNRNVCLLEWIIRSRQPTALSVPPHRTRRMLMAEMPRRSRHRVFQGIIQFPCWRKGWNVERMLWCTGLMSLREPTRALSYDQPVWRVQKWVALFWVITRMRFLFP